MLQLMAMSEQKPAGPCISRQQPHKVGLQIPVFSSYTVPFSTSLKNTCVVKNKDHLLNNHHVSEVLKSLINFINTCVSSFWSYAATTVCVLAWHSSMLTHIRMVVIPYLHVHILQCIDSLYSA